MNWIVVDQRRARVASMPGEDPDYYTMHVAREARRLVVCSVPLSSVESWRPIEPGIMEVPLCTSSRSVAANR
jgi:hypothetical protein